MSKTIEYGNQGLFDEYINNLDVRAYDKPLMRVGELINWEIFEPVIYKYCGKKTSSNNGRPHFDYMQLFKVLVLQKIHGLSDDETSYQIADRCSFKVFLGMVAQDKVPDGQTICDFREKLTQAGAFDELFEKFLTHLKEQFGLEMAKKGVMVDASFVEVPKMRNTREENKAIKKGEIPEHIAANPHKDTDADWTKKNETSYFGYKNHVKVDAKTKLIIASEVTPASVHDSQVIEKLVKEGDKVVYADSAYKSAKIQEDLEGKNVREKIRSKATRGKKLTKKQAQENIKISQTRARVEHVFAHMEISMRAMYQRCIGFVRNEAQIKLTNLVYNLMRFEQIVRLEIA